MSKKIITIVFVSLLIPQITFASWWNPFTWFQKSAKTEQQVLLPKTEQKKEVQTQTATTSPVSSTVKTAPKPNRVVVTPPVEAKKQVVQTKSGDPIAMWEAGTPMRCVFTPAETTSNINESPLTMLFYEKHYKSENERGSLLFNREGTYTQKRVGHSAIYSKLGCSAELFALKTPEEQKEFIQKRGKGPISMEEESQLLIEEGRVALLRPGTRCESVPSVDLSAPKGIKFMDFCELMKSAYPQKKSGNRVEAKVTTPPSPPVVSALAPEETPDHGRIRDVTDINHELALYYSEYTEYPKELNVLVPRFMPQMLTDPITGSPYYYVVAADGMKYSLGTSLDDKSNPALLQDGDGQGGPLSAFGSDTIGCRGEVDKYCYDVSME
jgi:hypothetical protein